MTLASSIILDAYRESNLIPLVSSPSTAQVTEALRRLNGLLLSTVGNEAGNDLVDLNIDGAFDELTVVADWVPINARLVLNLTASRSISLDPYARDGQRLAVVDILGNLATFPLTLDGNGRLIEGADTLVLDEDALVAQWMYRADIGSWVRIAGLEEDDEIPFPGEFDDYFITMLAMRLNPRYGQELPPLTAQALTRSRSQLRARYNKPQEMLSDVDTRGMLSERWYYSSRDRFNTGRIYPWR